jgi:hypothetical protein
MKKKKRIEKLVNIRKQMLLANLDKDEKRYWSLLREHMKFEIKSGKYWISKFDWLKICRKVSEWAKKTGVLKKLQELDEIKQ